MRNQYDTDLIRFLSDGIRTSKEIAAAVGCTAKYVQAYTLRHNLPRRGRGSASGEMNGAYKCGRSIARDGYAYVRAPADHPNAIVRPNRKTGKIAEHRLVMEVKIGRHLRPDEVVDHIDGIHLHNHPDNLRLFESNAEHLKSTISGFRPNWSKEGFEKMKMRNRLSQDHERVDTYRDQRKRGDVRLKQILLAWLSLDKDSPFLLGTHQYLEKAGIDPTRPSSLKAALHALSRT